MGYILLEIAWKWIGRKPWIPATAELSSRHVIIINEALSFWFLVSKVRKEYTVQYTKEGHVPLYDDQLFHVVSLFFLFMLYCDFISVY